MRSHTRSTRLAIIKLYLRVRAARVPGKDIMRQYPRSTRLAIITLYLRVRRARKVLAGYRVGFGDDHALVHVAFNELTCADNALQSVIRAVFYNLHD